jgi:hypothetical protein
MLQSPPTPSTIINGNRTSSGTILTIPAGLTFTGDVSISGSIAVAATGHATVTASGTGSIPATGSVVADLSLGGLALTTVAGSTFMEIVVVAPAGNSVDLVFATGGMSAASVVINGFTF